MPIPNFNIISSKSLEKQLKVVDTKIQELQSEINDLEKIRAACQTLLGNTSEVVTEPAAEPKAETAGTVSPRKKAPKRAPAAEEEGEEREPEERDPEERDPIRVSELRSQAETVGNA